ncbi:MAG: hypothetical protein LBS37_04755 [Treponema sp.]|jgi:hypothetical protein|nr:hypothetical protein [Treponema sp.]
MIDRKALVSRHNPCYERAMTGAPLSLGNGSFCFTADFTGLQSFPDQYSPCPLCTMAEWGWHSYPGSPQDDRGLRLVPFDAYGRQVGYAVDGAGQEELFKSLRQNPHRCNLAHLGLLVEGARYEDFVPLYQTLDMGEGLLVSRFTVRERPLIVETVVRPDEDTVSLRITMPAPASPAAPPPGLRLSFPYGSHKKSGGDFSLPGRHRTVCEALPGRLRITRRMDDLEYEALISMSPGLSFHFDAPSHTVVFDGQRAGVLELSLRFSREKGADFPGGFAEAKEAAAAFWEGYWRDGGALDLSASTDPRAFELERRIVLSQYLTAIQSRGALPPSETGLTCNSWYGKFHLEMYYWHSAHFALWNRPSELERSLAWYKRSLPRARRLAASQGYAGARWPKMTGPDGRNTPSSIAVLLVWQQPHPVLLAELCYRARACAGAQSGAQSPSPSCRAFLEEYREVVEASARFMASFAHWDGNRYVLGPPLIPAQERFDPRTVRNPGYEVEYFRWALRQANVWRKRLGEAERADFARVAGGLARPAVYDGVFPAHERCPATFTKAPFYTDHPSMLAMLGMLPGEGIDRGIMNATLDRALSVWDRESLWGWDFPMMAMCAARLGRGGDAMELLLMESPKNTWLPNGHNAQGGREDLPLYLPGNGGLLLAIAMLAAGWDGGAPAVAKGFRMEAENLQKYI